MSTSLAGRTALVTGAGAGMGRSHAVLLAERGANVIVADVDRAAAEATATMVREKGRAAHVIVRDVSQVDLFQADIAAAAQAIGVCRLKGLPRRYSTGCTRSM